MKISRLLFAALIVVAAGSTIVSYAAGPAPKIVGTGTFPINVKAGDYDLITQVVDLPPGGMIPKHTHGGPVVAQVISGAVTLVDATGTHTVKAGESFTENPGTVHSAANNGSATVRVSVSYLIPKGAEVTTFIK
jgi:quercetin dioxygenase-like cupin family protein